jgi:hypothetical protein
VTSLPTNAPGFICRSSHLATGALRMFVPAFAIDLSTLCGEGELVGCRSCSAADLSLQGHAWARPGRSRCSPEPGR